MDAGELARRIHALSERRATLRAPRDIPTAARRPLQEAAEELDEAVRLLEDARAAFEQQDAAAEFSRETVDHQCWYRRMIETTNEGVWIIDADNRTIYANDRMAQILGRRRASLTRRPVRDFVRSEDIRAMDEKLAGRREGIPEQDEFRLLCADGSDRWVIVSTVPMLDEQRHYEGMLALVTEVTHQKQVEEELRAADRAKSELISFLSHEIRTPITTILGDARLLLTQEQIFSDEERHVALQDIDHEADRLHRVIENMLALFGTEAATPVEVEPVHGRHVLERLVRSHWHRPLFRRVRLQVDPDTPAVLGDQTYFEQVVMNLLNNAEKYSPPDTPIDLIVQRHNDDVAFRVLDRGYGIPQEQYDAVFTPFFRAEQAAMLAPGVGIGLAVCRRLVELQGGRIWAQPREGGGTEMGFVLPVAREEVKEEESEE